MQGKNRWKSANLAPDHQQVKKDEGIVRKYDQGINKKTEDELKSESKQIGHGSDMSFTIPFPESFIKYGHGCRYIMRKYCMHITIKQKYCIHITMKQIHASIRI